MKNVIIFPVLLALVAGICSCTQGFDCGNLTEDLPTPSEFQVPLIDAEDAIARYAKMINSIETALDTTFGNAFLQENRRFLGHAFTIHSDDFLEAMGLPPETPIQYPGARAYLGIDGCNGGLHMYLTPIDCNDADIILRNSSGSRFVLDLIAPCPSTCDQQGSPLQVAYNCGFGSPWSSSQLGNNPTLICSGEGCNN